MLAKVRRPDVYKRQRPTFMKTTVCVHREATLQVMELRNTVLLNLFNKNIYITLYCEVN